MGPHGALSAALWLRCCFLRARISIFQIMSACAQQGLATAIIKYSNKQDSWEGGRGEESCQPSRAFS
eukprot:3184821-Pleurochrysis_carterae.AAC.1